MQYPGSSGLVFGLIREQAIDKCRMDLWEKKSAVADNLTRYFYPWSDSVKIVVGDGYRGLCKVEKPSFVLIDPPDLHPKKLLVCIKHLVKLDVPFICWTPRSSSPDQPVESENSTSFIRSAQEESQCYPIRWTEWTTGQTSGCCLTVSSKISPLVRDVVLCCVSLMKEVSQSEKLNPVYKRKNGHWVVD